MPSSDASVRTARRRVLLLGGLLTVVLLGVGAPMFVRAVERDLAARAADELDRLGVAGAVASFSGQSGTVVCATPLADPEAVVASLVALRGVDVIELERGCRVNRAPDVRVGADPTTPPPTTPATVVGDVPPFDSVLEVLRDDPRFSVLAVLLMESGTLTAGFGEAPLTVFAPTDQAFEQVPADVLAQLRRDPDLLARLLGHHVVPGALLAAELTAGPADTLAGTTVTVARRGALVRVDEATVIGRDLVAADGVVHAVDTVLLPDALVEEPVDPVLSVAVEGGRVALTGSVGSVEEQFVLVVATHGGAHPDLVDDELVIAEGRGLPTEILDALTAVAAELPRLLVSGRVEVLDGDGVLAVRVVGIHVDDTARDRLVELLDETMAMVDTEPRPAATEDAALDVQRRIAALLVDRPLSFAPGSVAPADAEVVLDLIAAALRRVDGLVVTLVGHTDSTGDDDANLELSRVRAEAVRDELLARGLPRAMLRVEARGGLEPIRVDGVEDVEASRRIEFVVRLATLG